MAILPSAARHGVPGRAGLRGLRRSTPRGAMVALGGPDGGRGGLRLFPGGPRLRLVVARPGRSRFCVFAGKQDEGAGILKVVLQLDCVIEQIHLSATLFDGTRQ